jgi:hypothetical protein
MSSNAVHSTRGRSRGELLRAARRDIGEIAVEANSQEQFRRCALECVCRVLALDASVLNELTPSGDVVLHGFGMDLDGVRSRMGSYLAEIAADEFLGAAGRRFVRDENVFPGRRKDELSLYTEYLRPRGFHHYCVCVWANRRGTFFMTILREGRTARYAPHDLEDLNALQSVLALGEALHASAWGSPRAAPQRREFFEAHGLTAAESMALDIVRCDLSVSDAAMVLGHEPTVIHERVVAALAKLRARHATPPGRSARGLPAAAGPRNGAHSPHELEALHHLLAGLSDREIAHHLASAVKRSETIRRSSIRTSTSAFLTAKNRTCPH